MRQRRCFKQKNVSSIRPVRLFFLFAKRAALPNALKHFCRPQRLSSSLYRPLCSNIFLLFIRRTKHSKPLSCLRLRENRSEPECPLAYAAV